MWIPSCRKMPARGPCHPWGSKRAIWSSAATCNASDGMWGLDMGAVDREMGRNGDIHSHNYEWGHAHIWHAGSGNRECLGFLDASQEAQPLPGVEVLVVKLIKVLCTQQWWKHPVGAIDQCMEEEASEWRLTCQSSKMRNPRMLWPTTHGDGMWPSPICLDGMINICCLMSSVHCRDSQVIYLGV